MTLISDFSPSLGMEDQSAVALLDWLDWLTEWFDCTDSGMCLPMYTHLQLQGGLLFAMLFAFLTIYKMQLPNFLHTRLLFLLTWIFWSVYVSHLFWCISSASVFSRHAFVYLSRLKDLTMKLSLIQSVGLIAKAIRECVKKQGYVFTRKQELINVMLVSHLLFGKEKSAAWLGMKRQCVSDLSPGCFIFPAQDFMKAESADSLRTPVRHLVMTTCANLMYPSAEKNSWAQVDLSIHRISATVRFRFMFRTQFIINSTYVPLPP